MDVTFAGTGETVDLPLIVFGLALLFFLLFFVLWFPSWRRRRALERKEAEYMAAYMENTEMHAQPSERADEEMEAGEQAGGETETARKDGPAPF